jgi:nitrogen regulatory protein PII
MTSENLAPRLLVVITDRSKTRILEDLLGEKHVHLHYMLNAVGTARSAMLSSLGLSGSDKTICMCMEPRVLALPLMASVGDRLALTQKGNGIAFLIPISGASTAACKIFDDEVACIKERLDNWMETKHDDAVDEIKYSLVMAVVNQGYSEVVMEAAHTVGIPGATVVHARRSGIEDAVKFFGVTLQAEKEVVAIVAVHSQKKELMQAITKACGINTPAHGLVISLPVENCLGISNQPESKPES